MRKLVSKYVGENQCKIRPMSSGLRLKNTVFKLE